MPKEKEKEVVEDGGQTAQAKITFQGETGEVLEGIRKFRKDEEKTESEKPKSGKELQNWINEALSESSNYIIARREYPKTLHGRPLLNELKMPCPTTIKQIQTRLEREMGGEKWWVQICDSTGTEIVGRYIDIDVPPIPQFKDMGTYGAQTGFGHGVGMAAGPGFARPGFSFTSGDDDDDDEDEEDMMNDLMKSEMKALRMKRIRKMLKEEDDSNNTRAVDPDWKREMERRDQEIEKDVDKLKDILREIEESIKDTTHEFQDAIKGQTLQTTQATREISSEIKTMNEKFTLQFRDVDAKYNNAVRDLSEKFTNHIKDMTININNQMRELSEALRESKNEKRIRELEQRAVDEKNMVALQHEITSIQKDFQSTLNTIRTELASKNGDNSDKMLGMMFQQMSESQGRIFEAVSKTVSDRMDSMSQSNQVFKDLFLELNRNMNDKKAGSTDPFESTERIVNIAATMAGLAKPGVEGDDPMMPFESRLVKAFTDVTPQVLSYLRERNRKGEEITEAELAAKMKEAVAEKAKEIAKGQVDEFKKQIVQKAKELQSKQQQRLLSQSQVSKQPSSHGVQPKTQVQQPQVEVTEQEAQEAAENALQSASDAAESESEKETEMAYSTDQEISRRVNHVLGVIDHEIDIMPSEAEWIDQAIRYLPRKQLVDLANAKDPKEMLPILQKYADKDILLTLGMKLMNGDKQKWLIRCLKMLADEVKKMIAEEDALAKKEHIKAAASGAVKKETPEHEVGVTEDFSENAGTEGNGDIFDDIADSAEEV